MMRTTLTLPEDVYDAARSLAALEGISLGDAVAELVRRGLSPQISVDTRKAFPSIKIPPDAPRITLEQTLAAEEEL
jgi:hypothetical protein